MICTKSYQYRYLPESSLSDDTSEDVDVSNSILNKQKKKK